MTSRADKINALADASVALAGFKMTLAGTELIQIGLRIAAGAQPESGPQIHQMSQLLDQLAVIGKEVADRISATVDGR